MKATLYMQSGHKAVLWGLKDLTWKYQGDDIVSLNAEYRWYRRFFPSCVSIPSICLSRVEFIKISRLFGL